MPAGDAPQDRTQAGAPPALLLQGIRRTYGAATVLAAVDLEVPPGEAVAILGANGAGKSTLLRIAATIARPQAGRVEVAGVDARREPERARRRLSHLGQEAPLYAELTPEEHLRWWARAQGVPRPDLLAAAGLHAVRNRPARALSRGQRQRLALAMALLPERPLLLLDEPFAALDEEGAAWLRGELDARRGRHAIVVALHDAGELPHARPLRLEGGRLEAR